MNYILHSKSKKNVKHKFLTFFFSRSFLARARQMTSAVAKARKVWKFPVTKVKVLQYFKTKLNSTRRENYVSLGWKPIMPLCPDKHQLTMNSKKKKMKIIQWTSLRMNSKIKIRLARKYFYSWLLDWRTTARKTLKVW